MCANDGENKEKMQTATADSTSFYMPSHYHSFSSNKEEEEKRGQHLAAHRALDKIPLCKLLLRVRKRAVGASTRTPSLTIRTHR